jgi:hypothetical protein
VPHPARQISAAASAPATAVQRAAHFAAEACNATCANAWTSPAGNLPGRENATPAAICMAVPWNLSTSRTDASYKDPVMLADEPLKVAAVPTGPGS